MPKLTRRQTNLTPAQRLALIRTILRKAHDETESWEEDSIGLSLSYLCMAIADGGPGSFVDWGLTPNTQRLYLLFQQWFPADDSVWQFIHG